MHPEMYERYLEELKKDIECEILEIVIDGNFTDEDIERLKFLSDYMKGMMNY